MNKLSFKPCCLFILLLATCLPSFKGYTQDFEHINVKKQPVSTDETTDMLATEYTLPFQIIQFDLDTINNEILLLLKRNNKRQINPTGNLILLDLKTHKVRWQHDIRNNVIGYAFAKNKIVKYTYSETICYDRATGKENWKTKATKFTWDGWNHAVEKDNNLILYATHGIHSTNLDDGKHWVYKCNTRWNDYVAEKPERAGAFNLLGMFIGGVPGMLLMSESSHSYTLSGGASNILYDDKHIYFTDREYLHCMDIKGNLMWRSPFSTDSTSHSQISFYKDNILIVNYGYANLGSEKIWRGTPFIALANKQTGILNYNHSIPAKRYILDTWINNDTLNVLTENYFHKYDIASGICTSSKKPDSTMIHEHNLSKQNLQTVYPNGTQINADSNKLILHTKIK